MFTACTNVVRNFTRLQDIQTVSRVVAAFSLVRLRKRQTKFAFEYETISLVRCHCRSSYRIHQKSEFGSGQFGSLLVAGGCVRHCETRESTTRYTVTINSELGMVPLCYSVRAIDTYAYSGALPKDESKVHPV